MSKTSRNTGLQQRPTDTPNIDQQGTTTLGKYSRDLGYKGSEQLYRDVQEFYEQNGAFNAEEFADERYLGCASKIDSVLRLMGLDKYGEFDISTELVANEDNEDTRQFKI